MGGIAIMKTRALVGWSEKVRSFWEKVLIPIEERLELLVVVAICIFVGGIYVGSLFFLVAIPTIVLTVLVLVAMGLRRGFRRVKRRFIRS